MFYKCKSYSRLVNLNMCYSIEIEDGPALCIAFYTKGGVVRDHFESFAERNEVFEFLMGILDTYEYEYEED